MSCNESTPADTFAVKCGFCGLDGYGPQPRDPESGDLYQATWETTATPHGWGYTAKYGHVCTGCLPEAIDRAGWLVAERWEEASA